MALLSIDSAAAICGVTPKTIRYQLARAAAQQPPLPFARKHAGVWLLDEADLPALRDWLAAPKGGFQPGNQHWKSAKNLGRPKKSEKRKHRPAKNLRQSAKKAGRKSPA